VGGSRGRKVCPHPPRRRLMICFDTMVLIWGVQGVARPGQEEMIDRTRRYIKSLTREHRRVMIPTPALTEYLQHFDDAERRHQLELLERHLTSLLDRLLRSAGSILGCRSCSQGRRTQAAGGCRSSGRQDRLPDHRYGGCSRGNAPHHRRERALQGYCGRQDRHFRSAGRARAAAFGPEPLEGLLIGVRDPSGGVTGGWGAGSRRP